MSLLYMQMKSAREGDQDCQLKLIQQFTPLLRKYGGWLDSEDGYSELVVFFLYLLKHFPLEKFSPEKEGMLVNYMSKAVRHRAIKKYRKCYEEVPLEEVDQTVPSTEEQLLLQMVIAEALKKLSLRQREIIHYSIWLQYSDVEIAKKLGISRQMVHRTKTKALQKLAKQL